MRLTLNRWLPAALVGAALLTAAPPASAQVMFNPLFRGPVGALPKVGVIGRSQISNFKFQISEGPRAPGRR